MDVLLVLINKSPFHIVTLKSSVHVSLGFYNNKTNVYIKEVVISYIIPRLTFIHYHDPSPP